MKLCLLILSLALQTHAAHAAPAFHDATAAEIDVYSAYLDTIYKPSKNDGVLARKDIVIENEALDAWTKNRRAWEAFLVRRITGPGRASDACMAAFWSRPEQVLRFFSFKAGRHPLKLVRSDGINKALSAGWDSFYAAWPGAQGFLSFGVIAWGPDKTEALFTVRSRCGRRCGYRDVVYMQFIQGEWRLIIKESLP